MPLKSVVFIIIGLVIFYKFVVTPVIQIILSIIQIKNIKKNIEKIGVSIVLFDSVNNKKVKKFYLIFLFIFITVAILLKGYLLLIGLLFIFQTYVMLLSIDNYSKYNGVYENGIVKGGILYWEDIFSWKIVNGKIFSFLKNDGLRIDLPPTKEVEIIKELLVKKNIKEEN